MFTAIFEAKEESERDYDIIYSVGKNGDEYYIESEIPGSDSFSRASLGNSGEKKALNTAELLALRSVRPIHLKDIIEDILF